MACKFPFKDGNGDLHYNCTKTKLYEDEEKLYEDENSAENVDFLWCATETNEDNDMVFWGKCDLESSCFPGKFLLFIFFLENVENLEFFCKKLRFHQYEN